MDTPSTSSGQAPSSNTPQEKIDFFLLSAHELRTSLSAMKWLFKMLCDGDYGALTQEQKDAISQASEVNERMVHLLNDTMTTIKSGGVITYTKLPVHMSLLMAEIAKEFANEATQKHIAITYHQPADDIVVTGDESRLRMAFHNLVENAIKYSNPETEIIVTLSALEGRAVLVVHDQGAGIPEDKKGQIFEKFFRAENTTQTGTGLGLYNTKHVIEQHGGTIAMQSEEGKGTTMIVTLPLSTPAVQ